MNEKGVPSTACFICKKLAWTTFACPVHYLKEDTYEIKWICFDCIDGMPRRSDGRVYCEIGHPAWKIVNWIKNSLRLLS